MWPFSKKAEEKEEKRNKTAEQQKKYAQYAGSSKIIQHQIQSYVSALIKATNSRLKQQAQSQASGETMSLAEKLADEAKSAIDNVTEGYNSVKSDVADWGYSAIINTAEKVMPDMEKFAKEHIPDDPRYREFLTYIGTEIIHKYAPTQDSPQYQKDLMIDLINMGMSDYKGTIKEEGVLSGVKKDFLPKPEMLDYWAESKGFEKIDNKGLSKLDPKDVEGKYVLTCYLSLADSWQKRDTSDITDTSNKHWYSHCKSAIFDENGKAISASNPELFYNDTEHDATKYVPEDSISYVIDYKKLGLEEKDIKEGFAYQAEGINIMKKDVQDAIFRMNKSGLEQEDIIKLWKQGMNFEDPKNLETIEKHFQNGGKKEGLANCEFSKADNQYKYNLQDYNCAIQPTAPILYATAAKVNNENLSPQEADKLRKDIGLYNLYDPQNYGEINQQFNKDYKKHVYSELFKAVGEDVKEFVQKGCQALSKGIKKANKVAAIASPLPSHRAIARCALFVDTFVDAYIQREQTREKSNSNSNSPTTRNVSNIQQIAVARQATK